MIDPIDIFRIESSGVLWVESATSVACAEARIQQLALSCPAEYIVLEHTTGKRYVIKTEAPQRLYGNVAPPDHDGGSSGDVR
jgi:hypothetical protein